MTINKRDLQINEMIRDKEVRLIDSEGEQLGVVPLNKAFELAEAKDMDLVKIAPQAKPPVCKIMDYGKYRFEQSKKEKEARKNQKTVEVKEVRMSLNIDTNDFNTKVKQANKFLSGGDKVKVSVRFRGREMTHTYLGNGLLERFKEACADYGTVDKAPKMEGRSMSMLISVKPADTKQKPQ